MAASEFNRDEIGQMSAASASGSPEEELLEESTSDKAVTAMMPWALSLIFHLGIGLLAAFITMVTVHHVHQQAGVDVICFPGETFSECPGGVTNPGDPGSEDCRIYVSRHAETVSENPHCVEQVLAETGLYSRRDSEGTLGTVATGQVNDICWGMGFQRRNMVRDNARAEAISINDCVMQPGNGWADVTPGSGGSGHGPRSAFICFGGNAHHVVFCIDASGSMAFPSKNGGSVFDVVRTQMLTSISRLAAVQDFDIVMFQEGPVLELSAKGLQAVTPQGRTAAAQWLNQVVPHGAGSDPVPALNRAFDVLDQADKARKGKQIFLLTDGSFPNNDAVLKCVNERNKARDVHVFTYLYGEQDDPSAVKLMKDIATQSAARYKNIRE